MKFVLKSVVCVIGLLAIAACSGTDKSGLSAKNQNSTNRLLEYIPADTPYVFGFLQPMPDPLYERYAGLAEPVLSGYATVFEQVVAEASKEGDEEQAQRMIEFVTSRILSVEGMNKIGFTQDTTMFIYGNGLFPVMRANLSDGDLTRTFVKDLEQEFETEFPVATVGEQQYWHSSFDKPLTVVAAVIEDDFVLTLLPSRGASSMVSTLLGLEKPADSLADTNALSDLAKNRDYLPWGALGYLDTTKVASLFLDEPTGLNAEFLKLYNYDHNNVSDVCKTEIKSMTQVMPRVLLGHTKMDQTAMRSEMLMELRSDLATSLAGVVAPVPGVGSPNSGIMSMGMGLDIPKGRAFLQERINVLEESPYQCEYFAGMTDGLRQMDEALNQPIAPILTGFRGFNVIFDNIEFQGVQPDPTSLKLRGLLAMDNAPALMSMAALLSPQMAGLNLQPDGKAVKLDPSLLQGMPLEGFAAMDETSVALSLGVEGSEAATDLLQAQVLEVPPFMSISYDMDEYLALMKRFSTFEAQTTEMSEEDKKVQELVNTALFDSITGLFGGVSTDVVFTEDGVLMDSEIELK